MIATGCSACLGMRECWICSGMGCPRCADTGACHVCAPPPLGIVPKQPTQDLLATSVADGPRLPAP